MIIVPEYPLHPLSTRRDLGKANMRKAKIVCTLGHVPTGKSGSANLISVQVIK